MSLSEQVGKFQVKNILAKLKAGKTISQREQKIVENFERTGDAGQLTQREIASHFGISQPAVLKWMRNGCPSGPLSAIENWRNQQRSKDPETHSDARMQKTLREVELLEIKIRQMKGELIAIDAVREKATRAGALLIAELASMANDAPGMLAGADEATIRERMESRHVTLVQRFREALAECEALAI